MNANGQPSQAPLRYCVAFRSTLALDHLLCTLPYCAPSYRCRLCDFLTHGTIFSRFTPYTLPQAPYTV